MAWWCRRSLLWAAVWLGLLSSIHAHAEQAQLQHFVEVEVSAPAPGSFDNPPTTLDSGILPTTWNRVALQHVVPREIIPDAADMARVNTTWYRIRLDALHTSPERTYLYLPRWQSIGKLAVYADDKLLWHSLGGSVWNNYNHPLWLAVAEPSTPLPREILLRFDTLASSGGAMSTLWVGDESALHWRYAIRKVLQNTLPEVFGSASVILGLFSLAVWCWRRKETSYLFFALTAFLATIRSLHYYWGGAPLPLPEAWFTWITITSAAWLLICTYFFVYRLHGRRYPRLEKSLLAVTVFASLIILPVGVLADHLASLSALAYMIMFGLLIVVSITLGFASWRSRSLEGMLLSGWHCLNIPFGIHDSLLQNYRINIETIYLLPYMTIGTLSFFLLLMLRRYVMAMHAVETANDRLALSLKTREAELEASHAQLRAIEQEQLLRDERHRLMRDMHDGLGFSLTSALVVAENQGDSTRIAHALRECIDDLRLTIDSLDPLDTDLRDMLATLRHRLQPRLETAGIALQWQVSELPELPWLTPSSALQLLRILQECFSNALRHSGASTISIHSDSDATQLRLRVEDNGSGFVVVQALAKGGRGLRNLQQRAEQLRGTMTMDSRPGLTRMTLHLPQHL